MWLLDHNLPRQLLPVLEKLGIKCESAKMRGWSELKNGDLVSAAIAAGFSVIITKDVDFCNSAAKSLKINSELCAVLLTLPQEKGAVYAELFKRAWSQGTIIPKPGQKIIWPSDVISQ